MTDENPAINLVPETHLTQSLAPHWQKRFDKAIELLQNNLDSEFNWQQVADQCAISPSHFHYMFKLIFGEPPAQYQRRMRLKQATYALSVDPTKSVTQIALETGFSSSQALAKALKRELGVSASMIRQSNGMESHDFWDGLLVKLGQPKTDIQETLETELSAQMVHAIVQRPKSSFKTVKTQARNLNQSYENWGKMAPKDVMEGISISSWESSLNPGEESFYVGYGCKPEIANIELPAQRYICSRVKVASGTGYAAAWDTLFRRILENDYEPDYEASVLEIMHNPRELNARFADISMFLPIH